MTTEQATRAAILSAVRAFVQRVERRANRYARISTARSWGEDVYRLALYDELAALERAAGQEETARE